MMTFFNTTDLLGTFRLPDQLLMAHFFIANAAVPHMASTAAAAFTSQDDFTTTQKRQHHNLPLPSGRKRDGKRS